MTSIPIVSGMMSFIPQKQPEKGDESPLILPFDFLGSNSVIIQIFLAPGKEAIIGSIKPVKGAIGGMNQRAATSAGMVPVKGAVGGMSPERAASASMVPVKGTLGKIKEDP